MRIIDTYVTWIGFWFQRMQLGIVLTSLQDNQHVATVLGLILPSTARGDSGDCPRDEDAPQITQELSATQDLKLAELLMKTILRNLAAHTVRDKTSKFVS